MSGKTKNNKKQYKPDPVNTDDIVLPAELESLAELLAKNTHEVWSQGRIAEGWAYGEQRDDLKKTHPGLVPYENLTEGEKEYDRNTAMQTIKFVIKLGYEISKES